MLAAGLGTRMRSERAKVLHEVGGCPMLRHPLRTAAALRPEWVALVVGHQADAVAEAARAAGLPDLRIVHQGEQRGTGHAVQCAREHFRDFDGDVVVLYGDVPLIRPDTLANLVEVHEREGAGLTLLTLRFSDPTGYGRIVRDETGRVRRIVEHRDCTPSELAIEEVNPGFYCVRASLLDAMLDRLGTNNAQGELYLTDVVALVAEAGHVVASLEVDDPDEVRGVNTRSELAAMDAAWRRRVVERWMEEGVSFEDPATAYVGADVTIGRDTVIGPNVVLRGKTRIGGGSRLDGTIHCTDATIGDRVHLRFGTVIEAGEVGDDAIVGPYARLRPGTVLGPRVHVGNFVETKKAVLGAGTKANHLTYLGDCEIGPDTNVGAGTITCNYDGVEKHRTQIGARVQIGSDTQLVAPVRVGDDAYVAAGTTVTKDVPAGALAVGRTPLKFIEGWVERFRARKRGG